MSENDSSPMKNTPRPARRKRSPGARLLRFIGRLATVVSLTALVFIVFLFAVCFIVTNGPSEEASRTFTRSADETSALKFLPHWFLPEERVAEYLYYDRSEPAPDPYREIGYEPAEGEEPEQPTQDIVLIDEETFTDELEIIDIRKPTFKGKMLIVHDPSRVIVGTLDRYGGAGLYLWQFVEKYDAIAGTNAGSFEDPDGMGEGGIPDGLVMKDGYIDYGSPGAYYTGVIGFDKDYKLHVGNMTGQDALNLGLVTAVSFGPGPTLIKDGVKATNLGGGVNPRTCIGQREDGVVLIAVIEGRHPDSIGATYDDLADLMEEYGAVNAGNLDGGSSSAMIYDGVQITKGSNLIGARQIANAILVLREGAND